MRELGKATKVMEEYIALGVQAPPSTHLIRGSRLSSGGPYPVDSITPSSSSLSLLSLEVFFVTLKPRDLGGGGKATKVMEEYIALGVPPSTHQQTWGWEVFLMSEVPLYMDVSYERGAPVHGCFL